MEAVFDVGLPRESMVRELWKTTNAKAQSIH